MSGHGRVAGEATRDRPRPAPLINSADHGRPVRFFAEMISVGPGLARQNRPRPPRHGMSGHGGATRHRPAIAPGVGPGRRGQGGSIGVLRSAPPGRLGLRLGAEPTFSGRLVDHRVVVAGALSFDVVDLLALAVDVALDRATGPARGRRSGRRLRPAAGRGIPTRPLRGEAVRARGSRPRTGTARPAARLPGSRAGRRRARGARAPSCRGRSARRSRPPSRRASARRPARVPRRTARTSSRAWSCARSPTPPTPTSC